MDGKGIPVSKVSNKRIIGDSTTASAQATPNSKKIRNGKSKKEKIEKEEKEESV